MSSLSDSRPTATAAATRDGCRRVRSRRGRPTSARRARPTSPPAQRLADLIFFAHGGAVTHVGFYAGSGVLLHAPHTGSYVRLTSLSSMTGLVAVRTFV